jgi:hypothetical protein
MQQDFPYTSPPWLALQAATIVVMTRLRQASILTGMKPPLHLFGLWLHSSPQSMCYC